MIKTRLILFSLVLFFASFFISCNNSGEKIDVHQYEIVYLQKTGSSDKKELSKDDADGVLNLIFNTNYEYVNSDDINGWIYTLYCDDVTMIFGKFLTVINDKERKNYYSQEHSLIIEYLKSIYNNIS